MKFNDLKNLYLKKKSIYGDDTYRYISNLLKEAKEIHRRDWLKKPTSNNDHEQSWRAFKGKNLEKLIQFIIKDEVENLGLKVINGNTLERSINLPSELSQVKRNLAIDYGEYGLHLPDMDIILYDPSTYKIIVVISSKVTLRERIAQTGYWKFKLLQNELTKNIKVYFITPDEDGTLTTQFPAKKGRAIVEIDLDGSYVLTEENIKESSKVKLFKHFIVDLKNLLQNR